MTSSVAVGLKRIVGGCLADGHTMHWPLPPCATKAWLPVMMPDYNNANAVFDFSVHD
jgi:hypothetical protein